MSGRANPSTLGGVAESAANPHAVRTHLRCIVDSTAFKGSRRSQGFLQFVVEHALEGRCDDLKERVLGVELFGRAPSYDTGDDAIVRVTACDVRKRLHHFYAELDRDPQFRIELPPGCYVPEIHQLASAATTQHANLAAEALPREAPINNSPQTAAASVSTPTRETPQRVFGWRRTILAAIVLVAVAGALWIWKSRTASSPVHALPWSAMLRTKRPVHLVFCDPDIVNVQRLLNYSVSLSDYANQKYWPTEMDSEARRVFQSISFRGASVAAVDASMALKIDELLRPAARPEIVMQTARNTRLADFKTEDNFVVFGSPRSNPWVGLFEDQLDFTFEFDDARKAEFIRNRRPGSGEASLYVPTAAGWGTGQAYAIVALVSNPQQSGHVLLLAGSTAEATEAAGKLALNPNALASVLRNASIETDGPVQRFEILLRVFTMAGSPNTSEAIACHKLKGRS